MKLPTIGRAFILLLLMPNFIMACDDEQALARQDSSATALPDVITVNSKGLFPEGIVYYKKEGCFLRDQYEREKLLK